MLEVIERYRPEIAELCRKHQVKRLELFGSAARGDFDPSGSDLDFLVEFLSYDSASIADQWFGLQEDLQKLLGYHIDLTSLRTPKNPYFLRMVQQDKVALYAA